MVADRRNSPSRGRPSTSSRTVCVRLPWATPAMARVTSVVGRSKSSVGSFPDPLPQSLQFLGHLLVGRNDVVEGVGELSCQSSPRSGKADREIAVAHGL